MAEVIVVAAIVLTTLATLFVSINKLLGVYYSRVSYYDTVTLYRLGYYRDILLENRALNVAMEDAKRDTVFNVYGDNNRNVFDLSTVETSSYNNDTVFLVYNKSKKINPNVLDGSNVNRTFKDYVGYLSTSVDLSDTNYVLLMERCNEKTSDANKRKNDCKYAYLKVKDGYE